MDGSLPSISICNIGQSALAFSMRNHVSNEQAVVQQLCAQSWTTRSKQYFVYYECVHL